jgi:hypothetical protein
MGSVLTTITIYNEMNEPIATIRTTNQEVASNLIPSYPCGRLRVKAERVDEGLPNERQRKSTAQR